MLCLVAKPSYDQLFVRDVDKGELVRELHCLSEFEHGHCEFHPSFCVFGDMLGKYLTESLLIRWQGFKEDQACNIVYPILFLSLP